MRSVRRRKQERAAQQLATKRVMLLELSKSIELEYADTYSVRYYPYGFSTYDPAVVLRFKGPRGWGWEVTLTNTRKYLCDSYVVLGDQDDGSENRMFPPISFELPNQRYLKGIIE